MLSLVLTEKKKPSSLLNLLLNYIICPSPIPCLYRCYLGPKYRALAFTPNFILFSLSCQLARIFLALILLVTVPSSRFPVIPKSDEHDLFN